MSTTTFRRLAIRTALGALLLGGAPACSHAEEGASFDQWLEGLKAEARTKGVRETTLQRALNGVRPIDRVIELDRSQPEFTETLWTYLDKRVRPEVIDKGRQLLRAHGPLLEKIAQRHGVQPRFLVAFWGMESHFGKYTGTFPLMGALATLAHDERRGPFFRAQALAALSIIDAGDVDPDAKSSWAGAMGQCQFIPTTYRDFAVDFDGDRKRDLWSSLPDMFGSAANYLSKSGWNGQETWGREVRLPAEFDLDLANLDSNRTLAEWQALGVRRAEGGDLPKVDTSGSIILPAGVNGPAFLVYDNFRTIMVWNRSILYAVAVGYLADRISGGPELVARKPAGDAPLARADLVAIQQALNGLGFDVGEADGVVGSRTRSAIKDFQRSARLPADGYPSMGLLERLRSATPPAGPAEPAAGRP